MWIRKESAFDGIVPLDTFMSAQQLITQRSHKPTEEEILEHLKNLYEDCGVLTGFLINEHPDCPQHTPLPVALAALRQPMSGLAFIPSAA